MSTLDSSRRRSLLIGVPAVAGLGLLGLSSTPHADTIAALNSRSTVFGDIRQIEASDLNIGYAELGPSDGPVAILLHGWPHDIHSFAEVAPILAKRGYRVIVPYLRGYGSTKILSASSQRNGQQSVFAVDIIALMDALKIRSAILAGFDWGGRAANIVAAIWPERCTALVSASGYLIGSQKGYRKPVPPESELQAWFQYYFATERGKEGYAQYRNEFNRVVWQNASPKYKFDDATYLRTARSFDNPDHVAIVIHNYRWRLGLVNGDSQLDALEERLALAPTISVPSITLEGDANGAPHQSPASYAKQYIGKYEHRDITGGVGHNLPQEAPLQFADAVSQVVKL